MQPDLHLPPGTTAQDAEIFYNGQTLMIDFNGQRYTWENIPHQVYAWLKKEMLSDTPAMIALVEAGVEKLNDQLYVYAKCRFGNYNHTPDLTACGADQDHEHWNCGCNGNCCLKPLFRDGLKVGNDHLTARELLVVKKISKGKSGKVIADELNISQPTLDKDKQHIFRKLRVFNNCEITRWATQNGIV